MHAIFFIEDVLRDVSKCLAFPDLVRFSRTCKSIHFSTRELVWAKQESMRSLVAVLPSDLVVDEAVGEMSHTFTQDYTNFPDARVSWVPPDLCIQLPQPRPETANQRILIFRRPPTAEDLGLLVQRSRHVTRITYHLADTKSFLVFNALFRLFPTIEFFPILEELVLAHPATRAEAGMSSYVQSSHVRIPFSLLPAMKSISIAAAAPKEDRPWHGQDTSDKDHAFELLGALTRHSLPNSIISISYYFQIYLYESGPLTEWTNHFNAFVLSQAHSLQELVWINSISHGFLTIIPQLANLHTLELGSSASVSPWLGPEFGLAAPAPQPLLISMPRISRIVIRSTAVVRSLKEMGIYFPDANYVHISDNAVGFHTRILPTMLQFLASNTPSALSIHIESPKPVSNVTSSGVGIHPVNTRISNTVTINPTDLQPLMGKHTLQRLEFTCPGEVLAFSLTDSFLSELLLSWPSLTHLQLCPQSASQSTVSLFSLRDVARLSPRLEMLGIPLNPNLEHFIAGSEIDQLHLEEQEAVASQTRSNSNGETGVAQAALKHLNIDAPKFARLNEALIAEFLMMVFPNLEYIFIPSPPVETPPPPSRYEGPITYISPYAATPASASTSMTPSQLRFQEAQKLISEQRQKLIDAWSHVAFIVKQMQRYGVKKVAGWLRESAKSDIINNLETERILMMQDDDDADYRMGDGWEDEGSDDEEEAQMSD